MQTPEQILEARGITLPDPMKAVANYVPYVISGPLLYVSGQVSAANGELITGRLGGDLDVEAGQAAARACAVNLISQCKSALGELSRIRRVVKLGGFVNASPDFTDIPQVINGCSDLMVEVFGEKGRHARFAVASPSLPLSVAVEIDGIFEIEG